METLKLKAHIGSDGILRLAVPVGITDVDCDVVVTIPPHMTAAEWNQFVDRTAGSLADDPIERLPQGEYEQRDAII